MPRYTNEQIIDALTQTKGMLYLAAEALGCNHETITERAKKCVDVARCLKAHRGRFVDNSELKLIAAVEREEPWAIGLVLKTLGKDRGYVERQEHTGKDGDPIIPPSFIEIPANPAVERNGAAH